MPVDYSSIRTAQECDLHSIRKICLDAFMDAVAPTLAEKGVNTFKNITQLLSFKARMVADNIMLVCEIDDIIQGYLELKQGHHLSMLFVSPGFQNRGVGRSLVYAIPHYAKSEEISVRASLTSVSAYLRYGFTCSGEIAESSGMTYQPMSMKVDLLLKG